MLRGRRPVRSRLWPACLCSTDVRDEDDTYIVAPPTTPTTDNMADITSPDVDVGDGLYTIQITGGAPFGFRLSDDDQGQLIVSKVCKCITVVCRSLATAAEVGIKAAAHRHDQGRVGSCLYTAAFRSLCGLTVAYNIQRQLKQFVGRSV